jgi:S-adenosylmethionine:tRNA ribosyltransferase-isomerase
MRVALFDFELPEDLIALRPIVPRDAARLLIVREGETQFEESTIHDLPRWLNAGDAIVANDTRVLPVQLQAAYRKDGADLAIGVTLHTRQSCSRWLAFAKPGRKLAVHGVLRFDPILEARILDKLDDGGVVLEFNRQGPELDEALARLGAMPLPPYIAARRRADERDRADYQTIFANRDGAIAAPTAGLHFTPDLLSQLKAKDTSLHTVTLHVGPGTFLPVRVDDTAEHVMHGEWGEVTPTVCDALNAAKARSHRCLAVGTTSLRLLETAATPDGIIHPFVGQTSIFIKPGYRFRTAEMLLTNFHLPRSTLFMLVSAFCGLETMRAAYQYAIAKHFRFYSYGDACLLIRACPGRACPRA